MIWPFPRCPWRRWLRWLRGEYHSDVFVATARRWWSPRDRRVTRLSLRLLEFRADEIKRDIRAEVVRAMLFGGRPV